MWGSSAAKKGWKTRGHDVATLEEVGIAKKQAERWQTLAKLPEKEFDGYVQEHKEKGKEITTAGALKLFKQEEKKQARDELVERLSAQPAPKPGEPVDVMVVDPPWRYGSRHRAAPTTPLTLIPT